MRIATNDHHARLGPAAYRVIRPAAPVGRVTVRDNQDWWFAAADRVGAMRVAGLIEIAARSPRSLVHVPLRGDDETPVGWGWLEDLAALDLLLAQPGLQFPAHRWPEVRRRLNPGRRQSFDIPGRTLEQVCDERPGCWRRAPPAGYNGPPGRSRVSGSRPRSTESVAAMISVPST